MNALSRLRMACVAILMVAIVGGCSIRLTSDYDPVIDQGLTGLYTDLTAFVVTMTQASRTPAGAYDGNKEFYVTQDARVATLLARAEAHKALDSCPTGALVQKAVTATLPATNSATPPSPIPLPDVTAVMAQVKNDDCSVVLLGLIRSGYDQLRVFHMAQGALGIPPDARDPILVGGLGSLIRAALVVEIAKMNSAPVGG